MTGNISTVTNPFVCESAAEFMAYDLLPLEVQRALQQSVVKYASVPILTVMCQMPLSTLLRELGNQEWTEIKLWAAKYKQESGSNYPFTAADATILRYGDSIPKARHRPKRYSRQRV